MPSSPFRLSLRIANEPCSIQAPRLDRSAPVCPDDSETSVMPCLEPMAVAAPCRTGVLTSSIVPATPPDGSVTVHRDPLHSVRRRKDGTSASPVSP